MSQGLSPERMRYHELLNDFVRKISSHGLVYDIGKSDIHDYTNTFANFKYLTVDRDQKKRPDILIDMEGINADNASDYFAEADALLCNGVLERCDDPMQMIKACNAVLKKEALALFGIILLGYPDNQNDNLRFTERGALAALNRYGFEVTEHFIVQRDNKPSYIFAVCRKVK